MSNDIQYVQIGRPDDASIGSGNWLTEMAVDII
jgi:hypothetical protein